MNKIITSIYVIVASVVLGFSTITIGSFAAQPPMRYSDGAHNCVFVTDGETGLSYWYENGARQGVLGDRKNLVYDGTERGREIYDHKTNAWYWLDVDRNGAKAVSKEVYIPYIFQEDEKLLANPDKLREAANVTDATSGSEGLGDFLIRSIKEKTGKWVRYDAGGELIKGWYTEDGSIVPGQKGNVYFYDQQTGLMAKGWITIEGVRCHFNEVTGVLDDRVSEGSSNGNSGYGNNATSYDEFANEMLAKVNALRREQGVGELTLDEQCKNVSAIRVVEISSLYSHTRPDGRKSSTTWDDLGYQWSGVGENIAKIGVYYNTTSSLTQRADQFYDLFKNSPSHYSSMINSKWKKAYFNIYITYEEDGETVYHCVQTFSM